MEKNKRFDEYTSVDCTECEHYWTSACDGASTDKEQICYAYKATRVVDLEKIKQQQRKQGIVILVLDGIILVHLLMHLIGGYLGYA